MENASKALLMAGGILFTMLVVTVLLYAWALVSEYQAEQDRAKMLQELTEFNRQYTNYDRNDILGYELLSLVNKVVDYNQRFSEEFDDASSLENIDQYTPITLKIKLDNNAGDYTNRDNLTATVTIPQVFTGVGAPAETFDGTDITIRLFNNHEYTQSNAINGFGAILSAMQSIENNHFGGASNAQNLVKSRATFWESSVVGYNGTPPVGYGASSWYQQEYVESRYKLLTGKNKTIDEIREDDNVKRMLQYYEYMEFKKAKFKCTGVNYNNNTGRVIAMNFEII